jgi:K+-transporting ATPase KdpF subunit
VTTLFWLAGIMSAALLVYLFVALFAPERLQ